MFAVLFITALHFLKVCLLNYSRFVTFNFVTIVTTMMILLSYRPGGRNEWRNENWRIGTWGAGEVYRTRSRLCQSRCFQGSAHLATCFNFYNILHVLVVVSTMIRLFTTVFFYGVQPSLVAKVNRSDRFCILNFCRSS